MIKKAYIPTKKGLNDNSGETRKFYQDLQDNYNDSLVENLGVENGNHFHIYLIKNSAVVARFECQKDNEKIYYHRDLDVTVNSNNLEDNFKVKSLLEEKTGWNLRDFKR